MKNYDTIKRHLGGDYFVSAETDSQPSNEKQLGMRLGSGWTMDVIQTIGPEGVMKLDYLRYKDGDGTIHYFLKNEEDGLYYDEDGLGLKIKKIDKRRADYFKYFTGRQWHDAALYDLCLNTGHMPEDKCLDVVKAYMKARFDTGSF